MKNYLLLNEAEIKANYKMNIAEISPFEAGIPLIESSDKTIDEIYYYRWHSFCSHIKETIIGYVITEFTPSVPWEGLYGSIVCPAGHHMYEGRWIYDRKYIEDYAKFWFIEGAEPMLYSTWLSDSTYAICKVTGDYTLAKGLYRDLKELYHKWDSKHRMTRKCRLLYQIDDCDGMEFSASGSGCRPSINSYQYGDAVALSKIAGLLGNEEDKTYFINEYTEQKKKMDAALWDKEAKFYKTNTNGYWICDVREQVGYIPWYFNMPDEDKSEAWEFLFDENYFYAPYGPTTCERNHPYFNKYYNHGCLWNGPSWPFATSQTLTALGNLLSNYKQSVMKKTDYFRLLKIYANSQYDINENGEKVPYIDENIDPFTGEWLARKIRRGKKMSEKDVARGRHYNHSTYCDLVISGLAGLRARDDEIIEVNPLFAESDLDYFCADGILYHGKFITILWDKNGEKYNKGKGLKVYVDGELKAESGVIEKIII